MKSTQKAEIIKIINDASDTIEEAILDYENFDRDELRDVSNSTLSSVREKILKIL